MRRPETAPAGDSTPRLKSVCRRRDPTIEGGGFPITPNPPPLANTAKERNEMSTSFRNPIPTVDIIIEANYGEINDGDAKRGIVLIERRNPPHGWALPGGFVDYGESFETAAIREAKEETSLDVTLMEQFFCYSAPDRDPRQHTATTVYIATATGTPRAADDAVNLNIYTEENLPEIIAFDHDEIIRDYFDYKRGTSRRELFSRRLAGNPPVEKA